MEELSEIIKQFMVSHPMSEVDQYDENVYEMSYQSDNFMYFINPTRSENNAPLNNFLSYYK